MRKLIPAAVALVLAAGAAPAGAEVPPPPTDPVYLSGGGCPPPEPGYPCDPAPYELVVDRTYPKRLLTWAADLLP